MVKRIASTVTLWLGVFAVLGFFRTAGGVALVTILCVLTLREFYRLQAAAGSAPFAGLGMFFGGLITLAPWLEARFGGGPAHHFAAHSLIPLAAVVCSIRILSERPPEKRVPALNSTLFGLVYVALLLQYLVRIATPLPGDAIAPVGRLILCVWVVAVAKFCDTGALLAGLAAGRHPLAPTISPKKTWEGAVGGVLVAMLVGAAGAWLGRSWLPASFTPIRAALIGAPVAMIAIVSDLVESVIKRQANLKDSGEAVPGIGGIFDLTDSILLAAPVAYFLLGLR
jgi:phosphatidate cytidylyltransferase